MESLVGFFAFLAFCALSSGLAGLIVVILLRRRVRDLELKVQRLAAGFGDLQRELAARPATESPVPDHPPENTPSVTPPRPQPPQAEPQPAVVVYAPPAQVKREGATLESIENLVGTRWLNWIGALVVLVGIAFLLKYLYDRGWIGPAGRVGIGLAFGVGLLFLGEVRLRRLHDLFSQSVSAAGCGALFLTTFLAYKFYDFSGRFPTFVLLCWFAGFTVALAVARNGRILAYLGLLGAYLTPYLLSTGQDQAEALFSYLAVLALAAIYVSAVRGWAGIPSLSLVLTWIYYAGWYERFHSPDRRIVAVAGAAGLIIFPGALSLARGLWNRAAARMEECVVLLSAGLLGLFYLWRLLASKYPHTLGFVLCGIALVALAGLRACRSRLASSETLENSVLGLATGSLLLVIPACLNASGAMLAWALAGTILLDIGSRSHRWVLTLAGAISLTATLIVGASEPVGHSGVFIPIVNRVFVAWFGAVAAFFISGLRWSRAFRGTTDRRHVGTVFQVASCFMLLALLSYEAGAWFAGRQALPGADLAGLREWCTTTLCLLWALYPALWLRWTKLQPKLWNLAAAHYAVMGIGLLTLLSYFHHRQVVAFLNPAFLAAVLYPAGVFFVSRRIADPQGRVRAGLQLYGHVLAVILLSVELYQGLFLPASYDASRYWIRMALISAAWAVYATVVLVIGISRNLASWRWLALALLGVTLLKVFVADMAEVRQMWRVLSFLVLGALLMACSYAYSRHERRRNSEEKPSETGLEVPR